MAASARTSPVLVPRLVTRGVFLLALVLLPWTARGHVGSPDVFFDGKVGPYPAQITIRMPSVVPGRARIEVRPETEQPVKVSFLPLYSKTAIKNAPPAEAAQPVAGEPGLYSGDLWLMSVGGYSIEVRVAGALGQGAARIPVNSVATHQLPLPPFLADVLLGLGTLLTAGFLGIVYAAAGESVLAPDAAMRKGERRRGLIAGAIAAVILPLLLAGGWQWWQADEREFRRTLREGAWPDLTTTVATEGRQRVLHLVLGKKAFKPDYAIPLLLDHGKLLHTFLIREPGHDVFAHVHPVRSGGKTFDLALPELPEGEYKILCDLTLSDSGLSSTASSSVHVPATPGDAAATGGVPVRADPDDSWAVELPDSIAPATATDRGDAVRAGEPHARYPDALAAAPDASFALPDGRLAIWKAHPPLRAKHDAHLQFTFRDSAGQPLPLEPYMGMLSHAAILRDDGKIFAHLHPSGNYSMAAQSYFDAKIAREDGGGASAEMDHSKMHHGPASGSGGSTIVLPYEFPTAGEYRIWVQVKTGGRVLTAAFETTVGP
jgi:hypothetical protein